MGIYSDCSPGMASEQTSIEWLEAPSKVTFEEIERAKLQALEMVCRRMKASLALQDRRCMGKRYAQCLDAKQIVDWFVSAGICADRKQAVEMGRMLQKKKYIEHIWGSHTKLAPFRDASMLFRYTEKTKELLLPDSCKRYAMEGTKTSESGEAELSENVRNVAAVHSHPGSHASFDDMILTQSKGQLPLCPEEASDANKSFPSGASDECQETKDGTEESLSTSSPRVACDDHKDSNDGEEAKASMPEAVDACEPLPAASNDSKESKDAEEANARIPEAMDACEPPLVASDGGKESGDDKQREECRLPAASDDSRDSNPSEEEKGRRLPSPPSEGPNIDTDKKRKSTTFAEETNEEHAIERDDSDPETVEGVVRERTRTSILRAALAAENVALEQEMQRLHDITDSGELRETCIMAKRRTELLQGVLEAAQQIETDPSSLELDDSAQPESRRPSLFSTTDSTVAASFTPQIFPSKLKKKSMAVDLTAERNDVDPHSAEGTAATLVSVGTSDFEVVEDLTLVDETPGESASASEAPIENAAATENGVKNAAASETAVENAAAIEPMDRTAAELETTDARVSVRESQDAGAEKASMLEAVDACEPPPAASDDSKETADGTEARARMSDAVDACEPPPAASDDSQESKHDRLPVASDDNEESKHGEE